MKNKLLVGLICFATAVASPGIAAPPVVKGIVPLHFTPPEPKTATLDNGIVVYYLEDHELPFIHLNLRMKMSPADDTSAEGAATDFLSRVWRTGGTVSRSPDQLNEELEQIAAHVEADAGEEAASVGLSCMTKDFSHAMDIFSDVLFHPRFDNEQIQIEKGKALEGIRRQNDTPFDVGRRAIRDTLYGRRHYYSKRLTPAVVDAIKRDDLVNLYKRVVVPDQAMITVAGDFDPAVVMKALNQAFRDWKKNGRTVPSYNYSDIAPAKGTIFFVQKDFNQSRVFIGRIGVARHDPDYFPLLVANEIFGGGGPSRLFGEIRSRRGLAYMVGSFFYDTKGPGLMGVVSQTKAPSTIAVIRAIQNEIDKFTSAPPTADEISLAIDSLSNAFVFLFERPEDSLGQAANRDFLDYPRNYLDTYLSHLRAVTPADVLRVAKKYYRREDLKLIVVGDQKQFEGPLSTFGEVVKIPLKDLD